MSKFEEKEWIKHRSVTTKVFYLMNLALGIEYSLTFATLYIYLKDVLRVSYLKSFYSAISGSYLMAQIIGSLILSRIFDKCRRLRLIFFIISIFTIVGNILYTIPLSPFLLLAGRFISGAGAAIQLIMMSELTRSYPPDEVVSKFTIISLAFAIGLTFGPCINFAFVHSDFWFLGVHIMFANGNGLVLTLLFMVLMIISMVFVRDLSREFDLKAANKSNQHSDATSKVDSGEQLNTIKATVTLLTNVDIVLIFLFSFNLFLALITFDCWIPMVVVDLLKWELKDINYILLGSGAATIVVFLLISNLQTGKDRLFQYTILAFLSIFVSYGCFLYFSLEFHTTKWSIVMWVLYAFTIGTMEILDMILTNALAKMVPSDIQSYSESVRIAFSRAGAALGLFTAAFTIQILFEYCVLCISFTSLLFSLFILRAKQFQNPTLKEH